MTKIDKCFGKFLPLPRGPGAVWALTPRRVFIVSQETQRILLCDVDDDVADGDDNNGGVQVFLVDDLMLMMTMIIIIIIIIMYYTIKNTAGPKKCDFESRPRSFRDQATSSLQIVANSKTTSSRKSRSDS